MKHYLPFINNICCGCLHEFAEPLEHWVVAVTHPYRMYKISHYIRLLI